MVTAAHMQNKNKQELQEFGGLSGLEEALRTSTSSGIDTQGAANLSANNRQKHFGANKFKDVPQKAFFTLFWENLKDPTLILLMAAALVRRMHQRCALLSCLALYPHTAATTSLFALVMHTCQLQRCDACVTFMQAHMHAAVVVVVMH